MTPQERQTMIKAAGSIRDLSARVEKLEQENQDLQKQASMPMQGRFELARDIVDLMVKKGHVSDPADVLPRVAQLMGLDTRELEIRKEAARQAPSGFAEIAILGDSLSGGDLTPEASFNTALLGI